MSHDVQPLQVLDVADILPGLILPLFLAVPGLVPAGVADGGERLEAGSSTGQEQGSRAVSRQEAHTWPPPRGSHLVLTSFDSCHLVLMAVEQHSVVQRWKVRFLRAESRVQLAKELEW